MKKITFLLSLAIIAGTMSVFATDYPSGLPGLFTINAQGDQVCFSQGNLQFHASTGNWRFAPNQYEFLGNKNKNIAPDNTDWIDLFGWGTSRFYNMQKDPCAMNFQPYSYTVDSTDCVETNLTGYGPSIDQAYRGLVGSSANYDWGVYNSTIITNSAANTKWRTLTYGEWYYLLFSRPNASKLHSQANIQGLHGYVLLPDEWQKPEGLIFVPKANNWETNTYTLAQWSEMEAAGAVFLPAAGERRGKVVGNLNYDGYYWTSSANNVRQAYIVHFKDTALFTNSRYARSYGNSVRLARDINPHSDPEAKFTGFDVRGFPMGSWIYNHGGFQQATNLTIEETDSVYHKYTLHLKTGGQESSFLLGGVRFAYTNSGSNKAAFKTTNSEIHPDGKDRKIIIPTYPGDEIMISVADSVDYLGMRAQGLDSAYVNLMAGENILQATEDSIVITTSNANGTEVKVKIDAILCIAHHPELMDIASPRTSQKASKILRDGQFLILRGKKAYTLQGQEVK